MSYYSCRYSYHSSLTATIIVVIIMIFIFVIIIIVVIVIIVIIIISNTIMTIIIAVPRKLTSWRVLVLAGTAVLALGCYPRRRCC